MDLGQKSCNPTISLVEALLHLRRTHEAFQVLDGAVARRPADSALLLFAADTSARLGRFAEADKLLYQAREHSAPAQWHRAAGVVASYQNRKAEALEHWRELLKIDPLAHDAIEAAALLLAETQSRQAALAFLDHLAKQFPCSCPLLRVRAQWLDAEGTEGAIAALRQLLEVNPADAWAWRELALKHSDARLFAESLQAIQEAIRIEPHNSAGYSIRGHVLLRQGDAAQARVSFLEGLRLEIDNEDALAHYVSLGPSLAERKKALGVVAEELRRQVIFNNALFAYQTAARGLLPPPEVLQLLRDAHAARPDLWQAWSVLINQLIDVGEHQEARSLAKRATERFPLLPRLWVDLARVERAFLNNPGEIAALEKALEIAPAYAAASSELAFIYNRTNDFAKAREILEEAIAYSPLEVTNYGWLAHILHAQGQFEPAIARLQHAIRLDPGYEWAWNNLRDWQKEVPSSQTDLALELAGELTRTRAGEARSWLILAGSLDPQKDSAALFAAVDQALKLNPLNETAYDIRARALARLDRFEEALAECAPPVFVPIPPKLQLRAAWVEAQRGNLTGAIAKANKTVAEHPDFYVAWQFLADWQVQAGHLEEGVRGAEAMAALSPLDPIPLGYLGDLKLRLKDRAGAAAAFQRAFTLDPHYAYAGCNLFDLQFADRDFAAAAATLNALQRAGETPQSLTFTVLMAHELKDWPRALDAFTQLCLHPQVYYDGLDRAMRALESGGKNKECARVIDYALAQSNCNPVVGEFWVDGMIAHKHWGIHSRIAQLQSNPALGRRVILRYLEHLGQAFEKARNEKDVITPWRLQYHFRKTLKRYRDWLSSDTAGWGKVGYVLTCNGKPKPAIDWLGDWRNRPAAESWMLYNLVLILQRARRFGEARELILEAAALRHSGQLFEYFHTHAAFEEALAGNLDDADKYLSALPAGEHIRDNLRPLRAMTDILVGLGHSSSRDEDKCLANFKAAVKKAFGNVHPAQHERISRIAYRRFRVVAGHKLPRANAWMWYYYRGIDWMRVAVLVFLLPMLVLAPPFGVVALYFFLRERNRN